VTTNGQVGLDRTDSRDERHSQYVAEQARFDPHSFQDRARNQVTEKRDDRKRVIDAHCNACAGNTETGNWAKAEYESRRARNHDCGARHRQDRRCPHVTGAAQGCGEQVHDPRRDRPNEDKGGIFDGRVQGLTRTAETAVERLVLATCAESVPSREPDGRALTILILSLCLAHPGVAQDKKLLSRHVVICDGRDYLRASAAFFPLKE
jgi:hypothetical protein